MQFLMQMLLVALFLNLFQLGKTLNGIDISVFDGQIDCFQCIKEQNYDLMIIEIYSSTQEFNKDLKVNIQNALKANIKIDVYIFPNINMTAQDQINQFLGYMKNNSLPYNIVWIDIENTAKFFPQPQQNVQFLQELINACLQYVPQERIGIYASNAQWQPIMNGTTQFQNYKLWWARWDNQKNFDTYVEFGGWKQPYMKQISGDSNVLCCTKNIDLDWMPDLQIEMESQKNFQSENYNQKQLTVEFIE